MDALQVFSSSPQAAFSCCDAPFALKKLFSLMSTTSWFCSSCLCFWYHIRKIVSKINVKERFPTFSSSNFIVSGLTFFNPFQVNFCEWCNPRIKFHSFPCEYPVFLTLLKRLSFPHWMILATLSNTSWSYIPGIFFLGSWFHFIGLCICSVPVPYCFDPCSFIVKFEIRNCDASRFVLLSQNSPV